MSDRNHDEPPIWSKTPSTDDLNKLLKGTLGEALGMRIVGIGPNFLEGEMPVDHRTRQPFGILHGGATLALAETLASIAASLCTRTEDEHAVGLEINANHIRAVTSGVVTATASPIHIGRTTHVWSIHVRNDRGDTVALARMTAMILTR
jgi:1,4-dihydroxy-2-naphthoyl-CoA hydrolase